jgi:hypothetical protein
MARLEAELAGRAPHTEGDVDGALSTFSALAFGACAPRWGLRTVLTRAAEDFCAVAPSHVLLSLFFGLGDRPSTCVSANRGAACLCHAAASDF